MILKISDEIFVMPTFASTCAPPTVPLTGRGPDSRCWQIFLPPLADPPPFAGRSSSLRWKILLPSLADPPIL